LRDRNHCSQGEDDEKEQELEFEVESHFSIGVRMIIMVFGGFDDL
jgi:hypothetical protein